MFPAFLICSAFADRKTGPLSLEGRRIHEARVTSICLVDSIRGACHGAMARKKTTQIGVWCLSIHCEIIRFPTMDPADHCDECFRLATDADNITYSLIQLASAEIYALRTGDNDAVGRIKADSQRLIRIQEAVISAQRQHSSEHLQQSSSERKKAFGQLVNFPGDPFTNCI